MKILYYSPHPLLSTSANTGYATHIRETILGFKEHGHEVVEIINGNEERRVFAQKGTGYKKLFKKFIPKIIWRTIKDYLLIKQDKKGEQAFEKKILEFKPHIVYERAAYLHASGINICEKHNVNYCVEINAPFSNEMRSFEGAKSLFDSQAKNVVAHQLRYAKKVFVVSSALKKYFLDDFHPLESKLIVIPNSVNPQKIRIDSSLREELKQQYSITDETIIIGFVGSIFPYHGVDLLIEAFAKVFKKYSHKKMKLMIVGDGYLLGELKHLAEELSIGEHVIFTDSVEHDTVFTYIDLIDICVMAKSNWYGSPVKIFEYGAMGKAIIAPDVIPVKDVMTNEVDGLLVPPNEEKISEAMMRLIDSADLRTALGNNFRKKVLKNHTWNNTTGKILNYIMQ